MDQSKKSSSDNSNELEQLKKLVLELQSQIASLKSIPTAQPDKPNDQATTADNKQQSVDEQKPLTSDITSPPALNLTKTVVEELTKNVAEKEERNALTALTLVNQTNFTINKEKFDEVINYTKSKYQILYSRRLLNVDLSSRPDGKMQMLDKLPQFFRLKSFFSQQHSQQACLPYNPLTLTDQVTGQLIAKSRELFKPGTLIVELEFNPEDYPATIPTFDPLLTKSYLSSVEYVESNRSDLSDLSILMQKFEIYLHILTGYRFVLKMPKTVFCHISHTSDPRFRNLSASKLLVDTKPHLIWSSLYMQWPQYTNAMQRLFFDNDAGPGAQPNFNEFDSVNFLGLKLSTAFTTTVDQYIAEIVHQNMSYLRENRFNQNLYIRMIESNSSRGVIIKNESPNSQILITSPGINPARWNFVCALVFLDQKIADSLFTKITENIIAFNLFSFRNSNVCTDKFQLIQTSSSTQYIDFIIRSNPASNTDWISDAIAYELFGSIVGINIEPPRISQGTALGIFNFIMLLFNFVLWPKTFWRNVVNFSYPIYQFYLAFYSNRFREYLNRHGWFCNCLTGEMVDISVQEYNINDYDAGIVPRIFTPFCANDPHPFNIYELIRRTPIRFDLQKKRFAQYPYYNQDYQATSYYPSNRIREIYGTEVFRRLTGIITAFTNDITGYADRTTTKTDGSVKTCMLNLFTNLILETTEVFYNTIGPLMYELMESFPYFYDGFNFNRPYYRESFVGLSSPLNHHTIRLVFLENGQSVDISYYNAFFFNLQGFTDRPTSYTAGAKTPPPTHHNIMPRIGTELTDYSLSLYYSSEVIVEAFYIMNSILSEDEDSPLRVLHDYLAEKNLLHNSTYLQVVEIISNLFKVPLNDIFRVNVLSQSAVLEGRLPGVIFSFLNHRNEVVDVNDDRLNFIQENIWTPNDNFINISNMMERVVFDDDSIFEIYYTGLVFGLHSRDNFNLDSFCDVDNLFGDRIFDYDRVNTFNVRRRENGNALFGTSGLHIEMNSVIFDAPVTAPHTQRIEPFLMRVPYLSDIPKHYLDWVSPLIEKGSMFIHITDQKVYYKIEVKTEPIEHLVPFSELSNLYKISVQEPYSTIIYDTTLVVNHLFDAHVAMQTISYILPSTIVTPNNVVARNIFGNTESVPDPFFVTNIDTWGLGDSQGNRRGAYMPLTLEPKISSNFVNLNNQVEFISDYVSSSYPKIGVSSVNWNVDM